MTAETTPERAADEDSSAPPATPFHDLDSFIALRRLTGLWLAPDGSRLVVAAQHLAPDKKRYLTALWELDPAGEAPARRLTRGASGEAGPAFLPDGSLLFVSKRPDAEAEDKNDEKPALWLLPAKGGEARQVAARPGGVAGVVTAREAGTLVVSSPTMPGAKSAEDDTERRKERKDRAVSAILHEAYPVRYWDHDLGPDEVRVFVADPPALDDGRVEELRDLTPEPGRALEEAGLDISPDGRTIVTTWVEREPRGDLRVDLVAIDTATGDRRVLASDPAYDHGGPRISPDGRWVVCARELRSTTDSPVDLTLWLVPLDGGDGRDLTPDLDLWPHGPQWAPNSGTVYFTADERGRCPAFAVGVETGEVRRLASDGVYAALAPAPDGRTVYALRAAVDAPGAVVRLSVDQVDQTPVFLRGPDPAPRVPGRVTEVEATAADGTPLRAWLVLPEDASAEAPAPLMLWIHGGPLASWNGWHWRWNPWLLAAKGYAVLLPDPALSTGYGQAFVKRGWGRWGAEPFTDLMSLTDAACGRDDIDAAHTAAMGGSFGGYMANWVAGHTDRFKAIVTHASLWALDQFGPTTDLAAYWFRELTPERALANSPHLFADRISTPMLVIHGDRDYRVPIGEGLRLWWELNHQYAGDPADLPHRFLYFPDENHWVLAPHHAKVWYDTVLAFLAWHVRGEAWERPGLL
ncbi:S9 family peptidase [Actinopolymorpha alba]|uniref:S9 family peptidase n=1 Tax=Actinopolymorpha alba TaxID=533267 RepID=UPI00037B281C|nr:prolyl oligopeptidase family serine peptidase [Actinopolymorpha alba]